MNGIRDVVIRGSEKVIQHYRLLLAHTKNEDERKLYQSRIAREQRLINEFPGVFADRGAATNRLAKALYTEPENHEEERDGMNIVVQRAMQRLRRAANG